MEQDSQLCLSPACATERGVNTADGEKTQGEIVLGDIARIRGPLSLEKAKIWCMGSWEVTWHGSRQGRGVSEAGQDAQCLGGLLAWLRRWGLPCEMAPVPWCCLQPPAHRSELPQKRALSCAVLLRIARVRLSLTPCLSFPPQNEPGGVQPMALSQAGVAVWVLSPRWTQELLLGAAHPPTESSES